MVQGFIFVELHSLGCRAPCPLTSVEKGTTGTLVELEEKASVHSFHSMVKLSPAEHQARFSPLCGSHMAMNHVGKCRGVRVPQARS